MNESKISDANSLLPRGRRLVAALCLLFAFDNVSEAGVFGTVTLVANPPVVDFTQDTGYNSLPLSEQWVSYLLSAHTDDGSKFSAIDVAITGPLHQRWNFIEGEGFVSSPRSDNISNGDSHLISSGFSEVIVPWENNNLLATPSVASDTATRDYGIGTRLRGAWGYNPAIQSTSVNFAYIVVPKGREKEIGIHVELATNPDQKPNALVILNDVCGAGTPFTCFSGRNVAVVGNGNFIADNDMSPSVVDNTDFGTVLLGSAQQRTFTISNFGLDSLSIGPPQLTGPFSLVNYSAGPLGFVGDRTVTVALDTSVVGDFVGSISFSNNAPGKSPFNFALSARVVPEPTALALGLLGSLGLLIFRRRQC